MAEKNKDKLKVLVVDDTINYRRMLVEIFAKLPDVELVGTASNGQIALAKIKILKPDLITLDVELPIMGGLELLEEIKKQNIAVGTIMLSAKTIAGSEATLRALELGAFDFISKPDVLSEGLNKNNLEMSVKIALNAFKRRKMLLGGRRTSALTVKAEAESAGLKPLTDIRKFNPPGNSKVVAIGISTGGPNALVKLIPSLPGDIGVPILLVQHMPPVFTNSMAKSLNSKSALTVREAVHGEEVKANTVYVAPGNVHMAVVSAGGIKKKIILDKDGPKENNCRPSVDYLFRSVAREYGAKSTCVIMTGMGVDGKLGMEATKASGACTIAQDEESSVVYGMPKTVVDAGLVDVVAHLDLLAEVIVKTVK